MQYQHSHSTSTIGYWLGFVLVCIIFVLGGTFLLASPVQAALFVTSSPLLPQGQVGSAYYAALIATGDHPPFTWSSGGGLPPGLSLASSGIISGTPTLAGTFNFNAMVTDSTSASATQAFVITVNQPPLRFQTTSLQSATEGEAYSAVISVSGGTLPYTWSVINGTLPSGLILGGSTGYLSGTPDPGTAGSYTFAVTVTDSTAPTPISGQQSYFLTVEKGGFQVTVTISSGLKAGETRVMKENSPVATLRGGASTKLDFNLGETATISVDPIVQHPSESGIRFEAEEPEMTVSESSPEADFTYDPEYSIELKTEPSNVAQLTGSGWYKEVYTLRASAPSEVQDQNNSGTQYRFSTWTLPTGETVSGNDLALTVSAPGICIANYDTYYKLTVVSPYGEAEGSDWYKAGSAAEWRINSPEVRMSGILGIFGGKLKAINVVGSETMDSAKTINIDWGTDYTMPIILMPLTLVFIMLLCYGLYRLLHSLQPKPASFPAPFPPPFRPMPPPPFQPMPPPPPSTTVVMIGGDKPKLGPPTTREQLMEKFGELLERYEDEIKDKILPQGSPGVKTIAAAKVPPAAELPPPTPVEAEAASEGESTACNYTSKRPLRVVSTNWKKVATKDAPPQPAEETAEGIAGPVVVWARDIYQEWEISTCWLPRGHEEKHDGPVQIVYSLINTVTEVKLYNPEQELTPPKPHYTDGMPQVDISAREIVPSDKLPPETISSY